MDLMDVCVGIVLHVTTKSIRDGSFFSKSKLTLQKWMLAILWWSREYPVADMAMEVEITDICI